jgi:hypothetical protein
MTKQMGPTLTLLATVEDQASGEFFAVIKYRDIYGGVRHV